MGYQEILISICDELQKEINKLTLEIEAMEAAPVNAFSLLNSHTTTTCQAKQDILDKLKFIFSLEDTEQSEEDDCLEAMMEDWKRQTWRQE